jgi:uncharacterized membrane protein
MATLWANIQVVLAGVQHLISLIGILIILSGVLYCAFQYVQGLMRGELATDKTNLNTIRLSLARVLILGLEFIVAADLIGTTTTPDYYAVGLLAIIVAVRTLLSYSINREIMMMGKESF